jgi:aminomethyltransferase
METATTSLKSTPLTETHERAGARMVPFAGYRMPVQYTGIIPEHRAVRASVGLFDLSHMGEFEVRGPGSLEFLEKMTTNDVGSLHTYQVQYSVMMNAEGGIVDDLVIYHLPEGAMLVVNAANIDKDYAWLKEHCPPGVQLINRSDDIALIAIQGPRSQEIMTKIVDCDLDEIAYYTAAEGTVNGHRIIFSRTGYTGEDGFEIYLPNELAKDCWEVAMELGQRFDIVPIGLGARDTLRLEMKYALYGNDIDDTTNPIEAGLGWVVKLNKPTRFIGWEHANAMKTAGPKRKLSAFTMDEKAIPRHGCEIRVNGEPVGEVTSGTHSPSLDKGIGMGYIAAGHTTPGTKLEIAIRDRSVPATVIKPPFVTNTSHR